MLLVFFCYSVIFDVRYWILDEIIFPLHWIRSPLEIQTVHFHLLIYDPMFFFAPSFAFLCSRWPLSLIQCERVVLMSIPLSALTRAANVTCIGGFCDEEKSALMNAQLKLTK